MRREFMPKQKYIIVIEQDEDGIYVGSVPALKGCHSQGETLDELLENMKEAIEAHLEYLKMNQDEVPIERFKGISEIEIEVS
jgi:predicted RNase H-like HicB family nuclease